jgi:peptidoglycan hydrolase-like protein with peptidoglycan-binding domain
MKTLAYVVMAAGLLAACSNSNSDQTASGTTTSTAQSGPTGTTIVPDQAYSAAPAAPQPVAMDVRDAQIKLQAQGYYRGSIDGIFGRWTRRAVIAYQRHNGLGITASLDADTVASLYGAATPTTVAMAGDPVRDAQATLRAQGYYHGAIDGVDGRRTRRAIIAFQRHNGMPVTAHLDDATLARLSGGPATNYGAVR